uniref:Bcl-2 Bcl-2 homology region 1-3 domain-containing protein n=1 Tax=Oncorhynchus mykiss TaxID=8022 RepID=A0A8C7WCW1_ONCMY
MDQSEGLLSRSGINSPDPLVREAYLMLHDYINYVTAKPDGHVGPPPTATAAALPHVGDQLLIRFPIFFMGYTLHPPTPGGRRRDLAWSAVLSVYVLAGQMALHCLQSGLDGIVPQFKECVGGYVERVICPEIRDKGGWTGFVCHFGQKQDLEAQVKNVILSYFLWKQKIA